MTQASLLEWNAGNPEHLDRVTSRIGKSVLEFCRERCAPGNDHAFWMEELTEHVRSRVGVAPDSPGRILRNLRQQGKISYRVVNRRASEYEILSVQD